MSSTEARSTDEPTPGTTQARQEGSSAAERLGGPIEGEPSPDTARRAESGEDRRADTLAGEDEGSTKPARRTDADREADTAERRRTTLIPHERAESYNSRWNELKSEFVDEPLRAVRGANQLVGEVLDELEELFRRQRADLEQGLDSDQTSTEDLRQALGRYRSFFDRLLSF